MGVLERSIIHYYRQIQSGYFFPKLERFLLTSSRPPANSSPGPRFRFLNSIVVDGYFCLVGTYNIL